MTAQNGIADIMRSKLRYIYALPFVFILCIATLLLWAFLVIMIILIMGVGMLVEVLGK